MSIKLSGPPGRAQGDAAPHAGADGPAPHGAERRPSKTVKTIVGGTLAVRAAGKPDADGADGTVGAVAALVLFELIGETGCAGAAGHEAGSGRVGQDDTIAGTNDRAHHLSLKVAHVAVAPRQPAPGPAPLIAPRPPLSRAECRRRCGQAGFCDPASEHGCGGEYCGNRYEF